MGISPEEAAVFCLNKKARETRALLAEDSGPQRCFFIVASTLSGVNGASNSQTPQAS